MSRVLAPHVQNVALTLLLTVMVSLVNVENKVSDVKRLEMCKETPSHL